MADNEILQMHDLKPAPGAKKDRIRVGRVVAGGEADGVAAGRAADPSGESQRAPKAMAGRGFRSGTGRSRCGSIGSTPRSVG